MALSPHTITEAALRILSEYGLGDLSMRRLARDLDVQPSALYWHVKNKQEVFVLISKKIASEVDVLCPSQVPLALALASLRTVLLRYRDGAEIVSLAYALKGFEVVPECVTQSQQATSEDVQTGLAFTFGAVAIEQNRAALGVENEQSTHDFNHGLQTLVRGWTDSPY